MVKNLLKDPRVDPGYRNSEALRVASAGGHEKIVKMLLKDSRVLPEADNNAAIRDACMGGHLGIVELLLNDPRVDPSARDNAAIRYAVYCGSVEMVQLLLNNEKVNPADRENEALRKAVLEGRTDVVKLLLEDSRVDPNDCDNEALLSAVRLGLPEIVKLLVNHPKISLSALNSIAKISKQKNRANSKQSICMLPEKHDNEYFDHIDENLSDAYTIQQSHNIHVQDNGDKSADQFAVSNSVDYSRDELISIILNEPIMPEWEEYFKENDIELALPPLMDLRNTSYLNNAQSCVKSGGKPIGIRNAVQQVMKIKTLCHPSEMEPRKKSRKKKLNKKPSLYVLPSKYELEFEDSELSDITLDENESCLSESDYMMRVPEKYSLDDFIVDDSKTQREVANRSLDSQASKLFCSSTLYLRNKKSFGSLKKNKPISSVKSSPLCGKPVLSDMEKIIQRFKTDSSELREAALDGDIALVKKLMQNTSIDPSEFNNEAIRNAARSGHSGIVQLLLNDLRVDPTDCNHEAIIYAAWKGHTDTVAILLNDSRVNPSIFNNLIINDASKNGNLEIVRLLLNNPRFDPCDSSEALIYAVFKGHTEIVELLLQDGRIDPGDAENEAVRYAARSGHVEIMKLLLKDERVDPSSRNFEAFSDATRAGHYEIVKMLYPWVALATY